MQENSEKYKFSIYDILKECGESQKERILSKLEEALGLSRVQINRIIYTKNSDKINLFDYPFIIAKTLELSSIDELYTKKLERNKKQRKSKTMRLASDSANGVTQHLSNLQQPTKEKVAGCIF